VTLDDLSMAPHLVMHGYWEMWVTMCLAKRVKRGWQCIDVGAAFGYYTLLLAELGAAKIEAWEPNPRLTRCLDQTLALNGLTATVTVQAFAAEVGYVSRYLAGQLRDYGSGRLITDYEPGGPIVQAMVQGRPIGKVTTVDCLDFVKLDAAGMEPEAWQSLGAKLPQAALIKWTPSRYGDPGMFLGVLREQGYRIGRVTAQGDVDKVSGDELVGAADAMALWLERGPDK